MRTQKLEQLRPVGICRASFWHLELFVATRQLGCDHPAEHAARRIHYAANRTLRRAVPVGHTRPTWFGRAVTQQVNLHRPPRFFGPNWPSPQLTKPSRLNCYDKELQAPVVYELRDPYLAVSRRVDVSATGYHQAAAKPVDRLFCITSNPDRIQTHPLECQFVWRRLLLVPKRQANLGPHTY